MINVARVKTLLDTALAKVIETFSNRFEILMQ